MDEPFYDDEPDEGEDWWYDPFPMHIFAKKKKLIILNKYSFNRKI